MALRPHVVHVVGFSEADHEATAADVVEGCKIARRAIRNALDGQPDPAHDPRVRAARGRSPPRPGCFWRPSGAWPVRRSPTPGRTPPPWPVPSAPASWTPPS